MSVPKQPGYPNLNFGAEKGGWPGAGPPKRAFRAVAAKAALDQIDYWVKVAKGNKVLRVETTAGKFGTRYPTHDEQERAYANILLRFGIGTQDEHVILGNTEVFDALAEVLPELIEDAELIDRIISAVESRLNGEGQ